jgi:hypothetical protein
MLGYLSLKLPAMPALDHEGHAHPRVNKAEFFRKNLLLIIIFYLAV